MTSLLQSPLSNLVPGTQVPGTLALNSRLRVVRHTHGEWRISLYPVSNPRETRKLIPRRLLESASVSCRSAAYARHKPMSPPVKVLHQMSIDYSATLDYRAEVQGISEKAKKPIRLPSPKHFRQSGRVRIQECAAIVERRFGKNCFLFTGTIPGSGWRVAANVARCSGKMLNRVKQWFRDNFTTDYSVFSVWEFQKRGMLHLHVAVASNETEKLEALRVSMKQRWINLLLDISFESKCDLFRKNASWTWQDDLDQVQTDAMMVTKSIARYLSKYTAKATRCAKKPEYFCPSRWWSCDRKTQQQADRERVEILLCGFTGEVGMQILQGLTSIFKAMNGAIKPFRNYIWKDFGGINLFEKKDNALEVVRGFLEDNVGTYLMQETKHETY